MQGTILNYDPRTGTGLISAEDGKRYNFEGTSVEGDIGKVRAGSKVDFQPDGENGTAIYPVASSGGQVGQKSKIAAGLLAIFLGGLGIHKFYLGYTKAGIIMLLVSIVGSIIFLIPTIVIGIIALIEGIIYLTKSDDDFYATYEEGEKQWF